MNNISRDNYGFVAAFGLMLSLLACSFFVSPFASAESTPPSSEITLLDQDFSQQAVIPKNVVLGNNLEYNVTATLNYDNADRALEYKTTSNQEGSAYVGIEPFIDGNITINIGVISDSFDSYVDIQASTFWIQAQTLSNGGARVFSYYQTSPISYAYQSYDVPASSLRNGINTINIMVSGTARNLTVYFDSTHEVTTPLSDWSVQKLPYYPMTLPTIRLDNEKSASSTWMSTLLYGVKETVNGGLVSAVPGNNFIPFGIDYPRESEGGSIANSLGTQYMAAHNQKGVAWADLGYLGNDKQDIQFIKSLLDSGWELGIHYNTQLNNLSIADAESFMQDQYNQITEILGQSPTSWCSFQNEDNVTHAAFAYNELGMIWRNGYSGDGYIANIGNLEETRWAGFWSNISAAQMVYPSFTHQTDQASPENYSIGYTNFTKWVDNYNGKDIIGFSEYYYRLRNQIDSKIDYLSYIEGESLKFSVKCNQFPSRLIVTFPMAENALVLRNGKALINNVDYSVIDSDHIALFSKSNDVIEITSSNLPNVTLANTPGAPTIISATPTGGNIVLVWTAPSNDGGSNITGYKVYRGTSLDSEGLLASLGNVLEFTDTALANNVTYYYKVTAINELGEGNLSNEVSALSLDHGNSMLSTGEGQGTYLIIPILVTAVIVGIGVCLMSLRKKRI